MGFGHRVYKNYDPRAAVIKDKASQVLDSLNIDSKSRNLSFLDGEKIIPDKIKIKKLEILFKKITS